MQQEQLIILGQTNYRNVRRNFGIKPEDRRRHTYIVGKTGMGKSTLLLNCIAQDIRAGGYCGGADRGDLAFPRNNVCQPNSEASHRLPVCCEVVAGGASGALCRSRKSYLRIIC